MITELGDSFGAKILKANDFNTGWIRPYFAHDPKYPFTKPLSMVTIGGLIGSPVVTQSEMGAVFSRPEWQWIDEIFLKTYKFYAKLQVYFYKKGSVVNAMSNLVQRKPLEYEVMRLPCPSDVPVPISETELAFELRQLRLPWSVEPMDITYHHIKLSRNCGLPLSTTPIELCAWKLCKEIEGMFIYGRKPDIHGLLTHPKTVHMVRHGNIIQDFLTMTIMLASIDADEGPHVLITSTKNEEIVRSKIWELSLKDEMELNVIQSEVLDKPETVKDLILFSADPIHVGMIEALKPVPVQWNNPREMDCPFVGIVNILPDIREDRHKNVQVVHMIGEK